MRCAACGLATSRRLCHFCSRTVALVKARRCVSCTGSVLDDDFPNVQGKCVDCLARHHRGSAAPSPDLAHMLSSLSHLRVNSCSRGVAAAALVIRSSMIPSSTMVAPAASPLPHSSLP